MNNMFNLRVFCKKAAVDKIINEWKKLRYNDVSEDKIVKSLVLPMLEKAGWNINENSPEIRISTPTASEVDIKIFLNKKILFGIECKKLESDEFKINIKNGALEKTTYKNRDKDGVGQLRAYSWKYFKEGCLDNGYKPILTNGYRWVIFKKKMFLDNEKMFENINEGYIEFDKVIIEPDFFSEIEKHIKKP